MIGWRHIAAAVAVLLTAVPVSATRVVAASNAELDIGSRAEATTYGAILGAFVNDGQQGPTPSDCQVIGHPTPACGEIVAIRSSTRGRG
jgi:hypothetical protein